MTLIGEHPKRVNTKKLLFKIKETKVKDKQLAEEIVKILEKYDKDRAYGVPELMELFKAQRQELKKKVEEELTEAMENGILDEWSEVLATTIPSEKKWKQFVINLLENDE